MKRTGTASHRSRDWAGGAVYMDRFHLARLEPCLEPVARPAKEHVPELCQHWVVRRKLHAGGQPCMALSPTRLGYDFHHAVRCLGAHYGNGVSIRLARCLHVRVACMRFGLEEHWPTGLVYLQASKFHLLFPVYRIGCNLT